MIRYKWTIPQAIAQAKLRAHPLHLENIFRLIFPLLMVEPYLP